MFCCDQELSTLYFLEDGIGRQLGGLMPAQGGSPTPDPAYLYSNSTRPWGLENLSIYVTHFANAVPVPQTLAVRAV